MTFDQAGKTIQWGKDHFQQMVWENLDIHMKKNAAGLLPYTIYKN